MKRKILIASFLKPVNDVRSYEKIAKSLAHNQSYEVYCSGYPPNIDVTNKNIKLLPLPSFNKRGFSRILARWYVFKIYLKLKPELIIVNSPDLLLLTCLYKIIFGTKIIYDIRENYFKNLWYQNNFIWGLKYVLAISVRTKEWLTSPLFDYFLLAEKVYSTQLRFAVNRSVILENKTLRPEKTKIAPINYEGPTFIISGTIAIEYGIFNGINFFKSIHKKYSKSRLIIIGHCPNRPLLKELKILSQNNSGIELKISNDPIPHALIENEILLADFGLFPYAPNESTKGKYPTKIFEFVGYKVPFIIQNNSEWNEFILDHNAGFSFNFFNQSHETTLSFWESIKSNPLNAKEISDNIYWSTEEMKLQKVVNNSFNN